MRFQIAQPQFIGQAQLDLGCAVGHFVGNELEAAARTLVIEQDARAGKQAIALPVVDGDPVAVDLGCAVRAAGVERGVLILGHFPHLSKHFRGTGLIETSVMVHQPDSIQNPGHPQGGAFPGQDRLLKRSGHEGLGSQVVDLIRVVLLEDSDEGDLIQQVTLYQLDIILNVGDAVKIDGAGAAHHAQDLVAFPQQELGQV